MPIDHPVEGTARRLVMITATSAEARVIRRAGTRVLQAGIGAPAARRLMESALPPGTSGVVSIGTAAGLRPGLPGGALVLPAFVQGADGRRHAVHSSWRQSVLARLSALTRVHEDTLAETDVLVSAPDDKARLFARTGAGAADMESAAIADCAASKGLPFLVVRVVLDPAETALPRAVAAAVDAAGCLSPGRLIAALVGRPGDAPAVWRLAQAFRAAGRMLAIAAGSVDTQLSEWSGAGGQLLHCPDGTPGSPFNRELSGR